MLIGRPRAPKIRTPAILPMILKARGGSPATFWEPLGSHSRLPALSSDIEIHRFLFDFHPRPPIFSDLQRFFSFFIDFHRFSLICIDFSSIFIDFHRFSLIFILEILPILPIFPIFLIPPISLNPHNIQASQHPGVQPAVASAGDAKRKEFTGTGRVGGVRY